MTLYREVRSRVGWRRPPYTLTRLAQRTLVALGASPQLPQLEQQFLASAAVTARANPVHATLLPSPHLPLHLQPQLAGGPISVCHSAMPPAQHPAVRDSWHPTDLQHIGISAGICVQPWNRCAHGRVCVSVHVHVPASVCSERQGLEYLWSVSRSDPVWWLEPYTVEPRYPIQSRFDIDIRYRTSNLETF